MSGKTEEEYFGREDAEVRHKLEVEKEKSELAKTKSHKKKLHYMKCSKCGCNLKTLRIGLVDVDKCSDCGAIVIAKGDLEKIVSEEGSIFRGFIELFKKD